MEDQVAQLVAGLQVLRMSGNDLAVDAFRLGDTTVERGRQSFDESLIAIAQSAAEPKRPLNSLAR
jgi:hypothetical protein